MRRGLVILAMLAACQLPEPRQQPAAQGQPALVCDAPDGVLRELWASEYGWETTGLAIDGQGNVFWSTDTGTDSLRALAPDGSVRWRVGEGADLEAPMSVLVLGDAVVVNGGKAVARFGLDGARIWTHPAGNGLPPIHAPWTSGCGYSTGVQSVAADGLVVFAEYESCAHAAWLVAVDPLTGEVRWRTELPAWAREVQSDGDGQVLVNTVRNVGPGDERWRALAFDAAGRERWRTEEVAGANGRAPNAFMAAGGAVAVDAAGRVLDAATGQVVTTLQLPSRPGRTLEFGAIIVDEAIVLHAVFTGQDTVRGTFISESRLIGFDSTTGVARWTHPVPDGAGTFSPTSRGTLLVSRGVMHPKTCSPGCPIENDDLCTNDFDGYESDLVEWDVVTGDELRSWRLPGNLPYVHAFAAEGRWYGVTETAWNDCDGYHHQVVHAFCLTAGGEAAGPGRGP